MATKGFDFVDLVIGNGDLRRGREIRLKEAQGLRPQAAPAPQKNKATQPAWLKGIVDRLDVMLVKEARR